jgi:hypothetical protein
LSGCKGADEVKDAIQEAAQDGQESEQVESDVNPANTLPSVDAGDPQTADEGTSVSLSGSASDTDGSIAAYQWRQESGTTVVLSSTDTATVTFTVPDVSSDEVATFKLTVTDNEGGQSSDTVAITFVDLPNTGIFLDGAVQGVRYRTSSGLEGMTNAEGEYQFNSGDTVSFYVGETALGVVEASTLTTVFDLESPAKVSQFLQSIDSDGIEGNGIQIEDDVFDALSKTKITVEQVDIENKEFRQKFEQVTGHNLSLSSKEAEEAAFNSLIQELLRRFDPELFRYLNESIDLSGELTKIAGANNADDTLISYRQRLLFYFHYKFSRKYLTDHYLMISDFQKSNLQVAKAIEQRSLEIVGKYQEAIALAATIKSGVDDIKELKSIGKLGNAEFAGALTEFGLNKVDAQISAKAKKVAIEQMRSLFGDQAADIAENCSDLFKIKQGAIGQVKCWSELSKKAGTHLSNLFAVFKHLGYARDKHAVAIARTYLDFKYLNKTFAGDHALVGQYFGKDPTDEIIQHVADDMCYGDLKYCNGHGKPFSTSLVLDAYKPDLVRKFINQGIDTVNNAHESFQDLSGNYERGHLGLLNDIENGYLTIEPSLKQVDGSKPTFCLDLNNITSYDLKDMEITVTFTGSSGSTRTVADEYAEHPARDKIQHCMSSESKEDTLKNILNDALAIEYTVSYQPDRDQTEEKSQTGQIGYNLIRNDIEESVPVVTAVIHGRTHYGYEDEVVSLGGMYSFETHSDNSQFTYHWAIADQSGNDLGLTIYRFDHILQFEIPNIPENQDKLIVYVGLTVSSSTGRVSEPEEVKVIMHNNVADQPIPDPSPVPTPTITQGVTIEDTDGGFIVKLGAASDDVTEYRFYRSTSRGNLGNQIYQGNQKSYEDKDGLADGITYYYTVQACNSSKCATAMQVHKRYTAPDSPPSLRGGVNIVAITGGFTVNSRTAIGEVKEYQFYRSTDGSDGKKIHSGTSRYYSDTGLSNGETYYYTIKACNSSGRCGSSKKDHKTYFDQTSTEPHDAQITEVTVSPSGNITAGQNVDFTVKLDSAPGLVTIQYGSGLEEKHMSSSEDDLTWTHTRIFDSAGAKTITVRAYGTSSQDNVIDTETINMTVAEETSPPDNGDPTYTPFTQQMITGKTLYSVFTGDGDSEAEAWTITFDNSGRGKAQEGLHNTINSADVTFDYNINSQDYLIFSNFDIIDSDAFSDDDHNLDVIGLIANTGDSFKVCWRNSLEELGTKCNDENDYGFLYKTKAAAETALEENSNENKNDAQITEVTASPSGNITAGQNVDFTVKLDSAPGLVTIQYGSGLEEKHMSRSEDGLTWTYPRAFDSAGEKTITVRAYGTSSQDNVIDTETINMTVAEETSPPDNGDPTYTPFTQQMITGKTLYSVFTGDGDSEAEAWTITFDNSGRGKAQEGLHNTINSADVTFDYNINSQDYLIFSNFDIIDSDAFSDDDHNLDVIGLIANTGDSFKVCWRNSLEELGTKCNDENDYGFLYKTKAAAETALEENSNENKNDAQITEVTASPSGNITAGDQVVFDVDLAHADQVERVTIQYGTGLLEHQMSSTSNGNTHWTHTRQFEGTGTKTVTVRAYDQVSGGQLLASRQLTLEVFSSDDQSLAAPSNLTATAGNAQVSLSWNAVDGADTYSICYAKESITTFDNCSAFDGGNLLLNIQGTRKTIANLTNGTQYYFRVTANNASNQESAASMEASATPIQPSAGEISHRGFIYSTVVSPNTGRAWLDRNLGASRVCQSYDDVQCYGDYYQWGREADGHEKIDHDTTAELSASLSNVGHSDFIIGNNTYADWTASGVDDDGSKRASRWGAADGSSICPIGYRAPNLDELFDEIVLVDDEYKNRIDAFNSFLRLPSSGRYWLDGQPNGMGESISLWSVTPNDKGGSRGIYLYDNSSGWSEYSRTGGKAVRCIKNRVPVEIVSLYYSFENKKIFVGNEVEFNAAFDLAHADQVARVTIQYDTGLLEHKMSSPSDGNGHWTHTRQFEGTGTKTVTVRAYDQVSGGQLLASRQLTLEVFSSDDQSLAAPSNLTATAGNAQVSLSWNAVDGADTYSICYAKESITTFDNCSAFDGGNLLLNIQGTRKTIANLTNGTQYYFRVTANNASNQESAASMEASATPMPPVPDAPLNLAATPGNGQVSLSWIGVSSATGYLVYYATSSAELGSATPLNTANTNKTITDLSNGTQYYFRVTAVDSLKQESAASSEVSATPMPPVPDAPLNLVATPGNGQVTLAWSAVTHANSYSICYAKQPITTFDNCSAFDGGNLLLNIQGTRKTIANLTNGTQYYFRVTANNASNQESAASMEASATPSQPPSTSLRVKLNDTGITWGGDYPSGNNDDCSGETITQQDCSHGRDAQAAAGTLNKVGEGAAGFDFTKLNVAGNPLADQNQSWSDQGSEAEGTKWACVRDNHTGLVWEVKTTDRGIHDKGNTYRWGGKTALVTQQARDNNWGTFYDDWDTLVDGSNNEALCGFSDWRVPTLMELDSIVDAGRITPSIDSNYFPNTQSRRYWSSSPDADWRGYAWYVYFDNGYGSNYYRSTSSFVRLVAGAQAPIAADQQVNTYIPNQTPDSRYQLHNNGTVTDKWTGLMWQRCSLGQIWDGSSSTCTGSVTRLNWQEALQQADSHSLAGYSDWRLPNRKELRSIVAYDRHRPAINTTVFPNTPSFTWWSSSPYAGSTQEALYVTFFVGGAGFINRDSRCGERESCGVRLVRE